MARPDVLLVSLGTTLGWRRADELLLAQLERAGARRAAVSVGLGAADRLRRGYPINDLVEMHAARRAARTAVERHEPRALIVSSTTAAMLLPSLPMPYAVRFDAPGAAQPAGRAERAPPRARAPRMRRARVTVPFSRRRRRGAARRGRPGRWSCRHRSIPPPPTGSPAERERLAVAYVPDPKAKGLDVVAAGWAAAGVEEARLEVYGLDPDWGRSHLRRTGVAEPDSLELRGTVAPAEFRSAPAPRPRLRPRRPLGGLGPGAARGAGGRRPARDRARRRPVRGTARGPAARALPGRGGRGAGGAGSGDPRGVRAAGRARRQLPRAGGGAAPPVPLGRGAGDRGARAPSRAARVGAPARTNDSIRERDCPAQHPARGANQDSPTEDHPFTAVVRPHRRRRPRQAPTARSTARSHASTSASGGWRSVTARLPAARRSRSSGSRTRRRSAVAICPRSSGSTTSAFSPSTATSPTAPALREAISGRPGGGALPERHAERLVAAHQGEHVRARVDVGQPIRRDRPREARRHAEPRRGGAQLGLHRPRPAQLQLRLALLEPGLGERGDQHVQVLVRHEPPHGQHADRARPRARWPAAAPPGRRSGAPPPPARIDPERPQPLDPLRRRDNEARHARRDDPVHPPLERRERGPSLHGVSSLKTSTGTPDDAPMRARAGSPGRTPRSRCNPHERGKAPVRSGTET